MLEEITNLSIYRLESLASQGKTKWNLWVSVSKRVIPRLKNIY